MTTVIKGDDLVESVASALQFMSYYHPNDFIQAMTAAWEREESPSAKDAMAQILINSRMAAEGHRPICQDTGIVVAFIDIGMDVRIESTQSLDDLVNEGVRQAYLHPDNVLRASILEDPDGARKNTRDNTPCVIHSRLVPGNTLDVRLAAKGGGSENKSKFVMLNPSDSVVDWVVETVPKMGAGWCPPGMLGIGIGGTAEKAMVMAKESLMDPINIQQLQARGPSNRAEELRLEIFDRVNALGIGAQGLGGLTTVLDVKVVDFPTHAASKPVAMIPNCAATRHAHFTLTGEGPVALEPPPLSDWPVIEQAGGQSSIPVNVDTLTKADVANWKPGDTLLLSGKILTGRDAAHKRLVDLIQKGEPFPDGVDFENRLIYYVGPVDPVAGEAVGPAGPTTASRMDKFTEVMLDKTGLLGMIGKAERGLDTVASIDKHSACYLIAVGGAAYLVSKAIKSSRIVAFEELGMEAIHEFEVKDMPVTVAVDSRGESVHHTAPLIWKQKIAENK